MTVLKVLTVPPYCLLRPPKVGLFSCLTLMTPTMTVLTVLTVPPYCLLRPPEVDLFLCPMTLYSTSIFWCAASMHVPPLALKTIPPPISLITTYSTSISWCAASMRECVIPPLSLRTIPPPISQEIPNSITSFEQTSTLIVTVAASLPMMKTQLAVLQLATAASKPIIKL